MNTKFALVKEQNTDSEEKKFKCYSQTLEEPSRGNPLQEQCHYDPITWK